MNNKNGFTLVEIIVVIALIAILAIVVGSNLVGLNNKQKEKDFEKLALSFEDAASTYVGLDTNNSKTSLMVGAGTSKEITVTLDVLIKAGFLNDDDINPLTNDKFKTNTTVTVTYTKSTGKFDYCYNDSPDDSNSVWNCIEKKWEKEWRLKP